MSHKPYFDIVSFKSWLDGWFATNPEPSKHETYPTLVEHYSGAFGKAMLKQLRSYEDVDSRWLHDAYGLTFRRDENREWVVGFNELVWEFLNSSRKTYM
ncbi:hypothetical protein [Photobacterium phage PDCC-1]|uniref:Uncharacterized protein n=1 Tax=Photobacterium phage PDCC-1 TaxID=2664246 RepID=A0A6B9J1X3_9CAUD|nr:hypothetical protein HWC77_gp126 [Photobacterium phage PDCC-1]QGZ14489.1 hypothetical protein [Photobacterium phage PDCC-1]